MVKLMQGAFEAATAEQPGVAVNRSLATVSMQVAHRQFVNLVAVILPAMNLVPGRHVTGRCGVGAGELLVGKRFAGGIVFEPSVTADCGLPCETLRRRQIGRVRRIIAGGLDPDADPGECKLLGIAGRHPRVQACDLTLTDDAARRRRIGDDRLRKPGIDVRAGYRVRRQYRQSEHSTQQCSCNREISHRYPPQYFPRQQCKHNVAGVTHRSAVDSSHSPLASPRPLSGDITRPVVAWVSRPTTVRASNKSRRTRATDASSPCARRCHVRAS